jgi:imidazole glycerol-phosphate synthase subunit HisH
MSTCIVNYGMGNLRSVYNAVHFLDYDVEISGKSSVVAEADIVILPGVGSFGQAITNIHEMGLYEVLDDHVRRHDKPFLGICLGMQLATRHSSEGGRHEGFGWIDGEVTSLGQRPRAMRVPHVGWNTLDVVNASPLAERSDAGTNYFFDHSYEVRCDTAVVSAVCDYGEPVVAALRRGNFFATQFHPEKSQTSGLRLLRRFFDAVGAPRRTAAGEVAAAC